MWSQVINMIYREFPPFEIKSFGLDKGLRHPTTKKKENGILIPFVKNKYHNIYKSFMLS